MSGLDLVPLGRLLATSNPWLVLLVGLLFGLIAGLALGVTEVAKAWFWYPAGLLVIVVTALCAVVILSYSSLQEFKTTTAVVIVLVGFTLGFLTFFWSVYNFNLREAKTNGQRALGCAVAILSCLLLSGSAAIAAGPYVQGWLA